MKEFKYKNVINPQGDVRIKDKHGHFLGKIERGIIYIYCKRCKEFYILQDFLKQSDCSQTKELEGWKVKMI